MTINTIAKICGWLTHIILAYLTCALTMWSFDISTWNTIIRFLFGMWVIFITIKVITLKLS